MKKYALERIKYFTDDNTDKMGIRFLNENGYTISEEEYLRRYENGKPLEWEFNDFVYGGDDNCILSLLFQGKADCPEYEEFLNELWNMNSDIKEIEM